MCSPYGVWILQSHGKALCPPGTTQGGVTSSHLHGFALRLTIFIYTQTSDGSSFILCFDYLMVLYLQNISRARKRLLCCSVKSCSHWAGCHPWQRACTRPGTAQGHKGSYTCPPCSSRSAEAPGGRFGQVQTVPCAPHCCCKGTGEKGVLHHNERFSKLLLLPHSGANNRDGPHSSGNPEMAFGTPARGEPRKWRHFLVQSTVLQLEGCAMSSAQT